MTGQAADAAGKNTYATYLQLKKLLSSQVTRTQSDDELLFIIMHQSHELWFKLAIHELAWPTKAVMAGVVGRRDRGEPGARARALLDRHDPASTPGAPPLP